jgi:phospholipase/lecithinase/hemolysin
MVQGPIRSALVALLVAVAPLGAQLAANDTSPPPIERLVIFGDSLSDPGNAYIATGGQFEVRPFDPIPDAPYLIGRLHFSNGPTWVEQLASDLDLRRSARPALLLPGVFTNYAVGGARARAVGPLSLGAQVELFLDHFDGVAAPEALYVLWIGATDLRDAAEISAVDPIAGLGIIAQATEATEVAIRDLYDAGARSFLVLNLPNIGDTPAVRVLGPAAQAAARALSLGYNFGFPAPPAGLPGLPPVGGLEGVLEELRDDDDLKGIVIVRFDVFTGLEELVDDPDLAGLTNVTDSCITPGVIFGAICRDPDEYLFWDFIHPTEAAHEYLSEQTQATVEMEFHIWPPAF